MSREREENKYFAPAAVFLLIMIVGLLGVCAGLADQVYKKEEQARNVCTAENKKLVTVLVHGTETLVCVDETTMTYPTAR